MIDIHLFGAIEAHVDGRRIDGLTFKQRQVLAILALADGSPVSRERLADQLWDGQPPKSWALTLDSYVCILRRALRVRAGRDSALATSSGGFALTADVDLHRFYRLAARASDHRGSEASCSARAAAELARGELLSEVPYAAWAETARQRFLAAFVDLGISAARLANGKADFAAARAFARDVVERDPICEAAWQQIMLAHWFSGDRVAALAAYADLREVVGEALGEEPGPALSELYLTILRTPAGSGTENTQRDGSPRTVNAIMRLLRQELEAVPGIRMPSLDSALPATALQVLEQSR